MTLEQAAVLYGGALTMGVCGGVVCARKGGRWARSTEGAAVRYVCGVQVKGSGARRLYPKDWLRVLL